jgi:kinesin family member 2/24
MVEHEKSKVTPQREHCIPDLSKINICVRKRPLFVKEYEKGEIDVVSWTNPAILVHKCKFKVDGITKFVENLGFEFDNTFSESENSDILYYSSIQPQIDFLFDGGIVTWFAYGQTGSGKTYTMEGVQKLAVNDFFAGAEIMKEETGKMFTFTVSYYEIYNGKVFDLLDNHNQK